MDRSEVVIPWLEVTPLEPIDGEVRQLLEGVDALRAAWRDFVTSLPDEDFSQARQRSLRRHAIETGIIERLYDANWGVTEALVAEGLLREVAEREGGLDGNALEVIQAQFDALEFLAGAARNGQALSKFFISDLHKIITRHQFTYEATDALGRNLQAELHHGRFKTQPNHVHREDGTLLQYTPPEHVDAEMDKLIALFPGTESAHPLVRAAWLHHRFVCIHPFEDGNGRVARALVLLVLLSADYAPLVVDRNRHRDYIAALDAANTGDLGPFVRLLAQLEEIALRSEIELPRAPSIGESAVAVARGVAGKLAPIKQAADAARAEATKQIALEVQRRLIIEFEDQASALEDAFRALDPGAFATVISAMPPEPEAAWWGHQLRQAAKVADFRPNLAEGAWWVRLRLSVLGEELRYVVAVQKVGPGESGILATTVVAELAPKRSEGAASPGVADREDEGQGARTYPTPLLRPTSADSVTLTGDDEVDNRWAEICSLVERTLAAAVSEFGRVLG